MHDDRTAAHIISPTPSNWWSLSNIFVVFYIPNKLFNYGGWVIRIIPTKQSTKSTNNFFDRLSVFK